MKKRILSVICAAALSMTLFGCGGSSAPAAPASTQAQETAKPAESAGSTAQAENADAAYIPEGTFNIRVFAAAGGIADTVTRLTAQSLQEVYGVTPIINNLTGANGAIAVADMDSYDPDIHEVSLVSMSLFTMAPIMNPDLNVSIDNYALIGSLVKDQFVLLTAANSGINSWEDLVEYGKNNKIIYGSNAPGGGTHVVQCALFGEAGMNAEALTSDGSNKDILAVQSGDAIVTAATTTLAQPFVESGDLIPIAVFAEEDYTGFEGKTVPALPGLGYDVTMPSYNFLLTRAGVDASEVKGLYAAIEAVRDTDAFRAAAEAASYKPDSTDGEALKAEIEKYAAFCKEVHDKYY